MSGWFRTYGFAEILPELLVGAYPTDEGDIAMLQWLGVKRILNLCEDDEYPPGARPVIAEDLAAAGIDEYRIGLTDFGGLPPTRIEAAVGLLTQWLDEGQRVYMHCRAGQQRSATVAAALVTLRQGLEPDDAVAFVQQMKPSAEPLPHQRADLVGWWTRRQAEDPNPLPADGEP
jgi:protein-tyrosine phosphatase